MILRFERAIACFFCVRFVNILGTEVAIGRKARSSDKAGVDVKAFKGFQGLWTDKGPRIFTKVSSQGKDQNLRGILQSDKHIDGIGNNPEAHILDMQGQFLGGTARIEENGIPFPYKFPGFLGDPCLGFFLFCSALFQGPDQFLFRGCHGPAPGTDEKPRGFQKA